MEAQTRGTFIQIFSEYLNITVWKDSGVVFIADNDVKAGETEDICAKVYDKKKKEWHGNRTVLVFTIHQTLSLEYKAPLVARIIRRIRNKVDLANQRHETFGLDHRTKRKNVRVSSISSYNLNIKIYDLRQLGTNLIFMFSQTLILFT